MREHHITVSRTARYFTIGDESNTLQQAWFVCHGYGQLAARFIRHFDSLHDRHRLIVAPEALSRFYLNGTAAGNHADRRVGATWMTREDRLGEIYDYVNYLDALYAHIFRRIDRARVQVHALGFSQGAATVCRWVSAGRARLDHLILWGGFVPQDLDLRATKSTFQQLRLSLVHGTRDEYADPQQVAEHQARLSQNEIPYRLITFDGGHHLDPTVLTQLAHG